MLILVILSFGETMTSYSNRVQAVSIKAKTEAMLAAEAATKERFSGCASKAIFSVPCRQAAAQETLISGPAPALTRSVFRISWCKTRISGKFNRQKRKAHLYEDC